MGILQYPALAPEHHVAYYPIVTVVYSFVRCRDGVFTASSEMTVVAAFVGEGIDLGVDGERARR